MTTALRSLLLIVLTVTGTAFFAAPAKADHYTYAKMDRLATRLEAESRTLALELRRHGYADANLRLAYREVAAISRDASHIHSIIHTGASVDHLHADVRSLQQNIHHVEEHLAAYGHFADHVQKMDALVHAMDDNIHDLEDHHTVRRPVTVYRNDYGTSHGRGGVSYSNGNFSIRLGR